MEKDKIVVFKRFGSLIEANIVKTKLDAFGIPCFLTEENLTHLVTPLLSGGIRLHVFAADMEQVRQVTQKDNLTKVTDEDIIQCPQCHSRRIIVNRNDSLHRRLNYILLNLLLGLQKKHYCQDCGNEFEE